MSLVDRNEMEKTRNKGKENSTSKIPERNTKAN